MKKQPLKLVLCIALVLCVLLPVQVYASESAEPEIIVQPMFTYIVNVSAGFEIESGQAIMSSAISAGSGIDQVRITSYLQKYEDGAWSNVTSWTKLADGTYTSLSKTYSVASGTYRLRSYFYVYINGSSVESTSVTTASRSC